MFFPISDNVGFNESTSKSTIETLEILIKGQTRINPDTQERHLDFLVQTVDDSVSGMAITVFGETMDEGQDSTTVTTDARPSDAGRGKNPLKTFWNFRRQLTSGGVTMILERVSNSTATTVVADWTILNLETCQVIVVAKDRDLNLKVVKEIAPNLAHWSTDDDLQALLDQCSTSGEADESDNTNLDRLGRRKRVPVVEFLDNLMSVRLGLSIDTIRSYRQRGLRVAEREVKEDGAQGGNRSEFPKP